MTKLKQVIKTHSDPPSLTSASFFTRSGMTGPATCWHRGWNGFADADSREKEEGKKGAASALRVTLPKMGAESMISRVVAELAIV